MSKSLYAHTLMFLSTLIAPAVLSAQVDQDLPLTATADCFSICLSQVNVKGVSGELSVLNEAPAPATINGDLKVQCNGVDVAGATQTLSPTVVPAATTGIIPYSIAFTPVAGCSYTVIATVTTSALPAGRFSRVTVPFTADCIDQPCTSEGCSLTQGFWKNHPEDWPVSTLTLGTTTYTKEQLLSILKQPVKGNGLVSLAHQLIAAKLNVANGATCASILTAISNADTMMGGRVVPPIGTGSLSTSSVGSLVTKLDEFNNGLTTGCPGHCSQ